MSLQTFFNQGLVTDHEPDTTQGNVFFPTFYVFAKTHDLD